MGHTSGALAPRNSAGCVRRRQDVIFLFTFDWRGSDPTPVGCVQEGGRLWEHPFQGRPRVNPTVKRGKEEKTHLLRRHRPSPGRIQDPLYTCIV